MLRFRKLVAESDWKTDIRRDILQRTQAARVATQQETTSATTVQAAYRAHRDRKHALHRAACALLLNRIVRGFLARLKASAAAHHRQLARERAALDAVATAIQRRVRGTLSRLDATRRHDLRLDLRARRAYAEQVARADAERRALAKAAAAEQQALAVEAEETAARARVGHLASRLHHMRSTARCRSIYNPPHGELPTALGVPVEEHLRESLRPALRREVAAAQRRTKPIYSPQEISPHFRAGRTPAQIAEEARQERWLSRTMRVGLAHGQADFVTAVGERPVPHFPSVHADGHYTSPVKNFERRVTKDRWVAEKPFYYSVPSNRYVRTKGGARLPGSGPLSAVESFK